jgi:hypothetical protein
VGNFLRVRWLYLSVVCCVSAWALALSAPAPSTAARPCWKAVIADWSKDNKVDGRYPAACIRDAMVYAPTDLKIYSSLEDDLQTALRTRSVRRLSGVKHSASAATVVGASESSSVSPVVLVLGGLAVLVATTACVAVVRRRRDAR